MSQNDVFIRTNEVQVFMEFMRKKFKTSQVYYQRENEVFKVFTMRGIQRTFEVSFYKDGVTIRSSTYRLSDKETIGLITIAERCIMTQD